MPNAENLAPNTFIIALPYLSAANQIEGSETSMSAPMSMINNQSIAPALLEALAMLTQVWSHLVVPSARAVLGNTGIVGGSGQSGFGAQLSAIQFILTAAPPGAGIQPGNPPRYPHIGQFGFLYDFIGGIPAIGDPTYLQYDSQMMFPTEWSSGGFYWRLNPGYEGVFLGYDNPANRLGLAYSYGGPVTGICNPYTAQPPDQEV